MRESKRNIDKNELHLFTSPMGSLFIKYHKSTPFLVMINNYHVELRILDDKKELTYKEKVLLVKDLHERVELIRKHWKALRNQM